MPNEYYLFSLGLVPLLASRGAMPLLVSALIARFGAEFGWLVDRAGYELVAGLPEWLTGDVALVSLGLFAFFEHRVNASPDLREALRLGDAGVKGLLGAVLCLLMVYGSPGEVVAQFLEGAGPSWFSFGSIWALFVGAAVWFAARLRNGVYALYEEFDPDDAFGIQRMLAWLETAFGGLGLFIFVLFPVLALLTAVVTVLALKLLQRFFRGLESKQRYVCECGQENHLTTLGCFVCGLANPAPRAVGLFGQAAKGTAPAAPEQTQLLRERRRCGRCAERVPGGDLGAECARCGTALFENREVAEDYLRRVGRRLPVTLLVTLACSLIPVVGLIPGMVYYRLKLVAGLRAYLPLGRSLGARWMVRLLSLILIFLQALPFFGILSIPLMALINFLVFQALLKGSIKSRFATA